MTRCPWLMFHLAFVLIQQPIVQHKQPASIWDGNRDVRTQIGPVPPVAPTRCANIKVSSITRF